MYDIYIYIYIIYTYTLCIYIYISVWRTEIHQPSWFIGMICSYFWCFLFCPRWTGFPQHLLPISPSNRTKTCVGWYRRYRYVDDDFTIISPSFPSFHLFYLFQSCYNRTPPAEASSLLGMGASWTMAHLLVPWRRVDGWLSQRQNGHGRIYGGFKTMGKWWFDLICMENQHHFWMGKSTAGW